jgi:hypothetical protein
MKKSFLFLCIAAIVFFACSKSSDNDYTPDCSTTRTFSGDANPLIQSTCATNSGCHGSGSANGPGPLLTYNQVFNARVDIRSAVASGVMPQNTTLSHAQKDAIVCWIDSGAPNN